MSTLNFIITDAGRQAAITADATGIQLTITEVGYGTGTWIPDSTATSLQSELKRLAAGGGENPAPFYVHIAVTDQSSDSYQANEVGIYAGDVLFAVWSKGGQTAADGPGKINTQDSAFVFDLLLDNVPPDSVTVGDANFSYPLATETKPGVSEIATQAEVNAGTDNQRFIVPSKLKSWWDSVRTWANIKDKPAFKSAALLNAGQDDGEVALIGAPSTSGRSAVVTSYGSNANGSYRIFSDGFKIMIVNPNYFASSGQYHDQPLPITLSNENISVVCAVATDLTTAQAYPVLSAFLHTDRITWKKSASTNQFNFLVMGV